MSDPLWDRWEEVDRVFEQALGLAVEERTRFLHDTCGDDVELFDTVDRLLRASERSDDVLSGPNPELLRAAFTGPGGRPDGPPVVGVEVGAYRILRRVGRGGTATVYEAERVDGGFEQRVAVKMLDGVDSDDLVGRFLAERRILSSLSHPNIAGILDGGATDDGRPYLVMEYVDGEAITRWADRERLRVSERLALFRQVVDAVAYAHERLVVHRDLKPSNVMVDREGRVRLLDFGIAKLLETPGSESPLTRPATRWMTPEYAAPEQILGRPVTTATDVHGLGVLLYQLLAGRRPFTAGESSTGFEVSRAICEDTPPLASVAAVEGGGASEKAVVGDGASEKAVAGDAASDTAVEGDGASDTADDRPRAVAAARSTSPEQLRKILEGDLDAILGKALRKDPEERYRSARALGDDLDRYRDGHPVEARTGLRGYRARKFVRRHRVGVGAAAAVGLTVFASAALLVRQQAETARERDRAEAAALDAEREAENARLVVGFLADVFRGRDPGQAPADTLTARELLDWGTERVDAEFADRPEVRAELLLVLGQAHGNMGAFDEGRPLLDRAVELRRATFGARSVEVADALAILGGADVQARDFETAVPILEEAVAILRDAPDTDEEDLADLLEGLANAYRDTGFADSSVVLFREALEIRERHPGNEVALVNAMLGLAYTLRGANRLDEAERLYEDGIPRYRALPDHDPAELATFLNNHAYLLRVREEYARAEPLYREALAIAEELRGVGHPMTRMFATNLASVFSLQGRYAELVEILEENVEAVQGHWPGRHWEIGAALRSLSDALVFNQELTRADSVARAAVDEFSETLGPGHDWTSFAAGRVGVVMLLQGDTASGRAVLDRLHAQMVERIEESGGVPSRNAVNLLQPFVRLLGLTGLEDERDRFQALLEPTGG